VSKAGASADALHERVSVDAICFPGESWGQIAQHWRELAPRRVGFVSYYLAEAGLSAVQETLQGGGYRLETMTHPFLGSRPLSDKAACAEARGQLEQVLKAAETLGSRTVYMLTGGHGRLTWEEAAERFCEAVAPCVAKACDAGVKLAIEPASPLHADLHIAHTLRDTVTLAERAGIGVCMDIFACWTEAGLQETVKRAGPRLDLVQISDYALGDRSYPCRAVMGEGDIPLETILGWILDAGYDGGFDLELLGPRIEAAGRLEACRRSAEWMGRFLAARGL
jgi:sugar phosphate isomerase/epimerase